jgi:hypothetical protein
MKFEVTTPVASGKVAERFYVEVKVMFGDADGFETFDVGPFSRSPEDQAGLTDLVETLRRVEQTEFWDNDGYDQVEGFRAWFDEDYEPVAGDTHWLLRNNVDVPTVIYWPTEEYTGYQGQFQSFKVVWYSIGGQKYGVEVVD